jgi:hypothetical protein
MNSNFSIRTIIFISIVIIIETISAQRWTPEDDFKHIKTFDAVLNKAVTKLSSISPIKKDDNEYFTNKQYDEIERLYFRYTLCTRSLLDIVNAYKDFSNQSKYKKHNVQAFVLGYCATLTIYKYSAELILNTANDPLLIDKLNEEYPRTEIKGGGLDFIISNLTNPDYVNNLDIAHEFYQRQLKDRALYDTPEFASIINELINKTTELSSVYIDYKKIILDNYTILPLEAADIMQVTTIEETVNDMIDAAGGQLKAIQEFLFTLTADVRMPLVDGIKFSRRQKKTLRKSLKPGDIILTFSSGYLSNIVLPGYFKHVLTYTGSQNQRKNKHVRGIQLKPNQQNLIDPSHDIIESNSDGVRTMKLESYLNGYIDRMIVFRPKLSDDELSTVIKNLYSFLGLAYDFDFDLENGEKQACTELIYRSYNGIGNINIDLEEIIGTTTLTGDNLLEYFINDNETKLILLAVENDSKPSKAKFLTEGDALLYLKQNGPIQFSIDK